MVKNNKKAFTIVEMTITMLIISLSIMALLPAITQSKPDIKRTAIKGQYACWRDSDNQLRQIRCDERACPEDIRAESTIRTDGFCVFELDHRPAHFYIAAIGSGSGNNGTTRNSVIGQVKTTQNPVISNSLKIDVPNRTINPTWPTVVYSDNAAAELTAGSGGAVLPNGLVSGNIKSCHLTTAGQPCRIGGGNQTGCAIVNTGLDSNNEFVRQVQILGCDRTDAYGNVQSELLPLENLVTDLNIRNTGLSAPLSSLAPGGNLNGTSSEYGVGTYNNDVPQFNSNFNYRMVFELYDSSYTIKNQVIGERQNQDADLHAYVTPFRKILNSISRERNSTLIEYLKNNDFGNVGRNGAVLILW